MYTYSGGQNDQNASIFTSKNMVLSQLFLSFAVVYQ